MFGIGFQEMVFLAVIALLVFGPKRLPELARTLGKGMAEFRRASADLRGALSLEPDPTRPAPTRPRAKTPDDEPDPREDRDYQPAPDQAVGGPDPAAETALSAAETALSAAEAAVMAELSDEANDEQHRDEPGASTSEERHLDELGASTSDDPAAGSIGGETDAPTRSERSD